MSLYGFSLLQSLLGIFESPSLRSCAFVVIGAVDVFILCHLRMRVYHEWRIFVIEDEYRPRKPNMCHKKRICAIGGKYVP